jgi:hypothetical protein
VVVELVDYLGAKEPTDAPVILRPPLDILRVRPHEIPKGPFCGDFLKPVDFPDLVDSVDLR